MRLLLGVVFVGVIPRRLRPIPCVRGIAPYAMKVARRHSQENAGHALRPPLPLERGSVNFIDDKNGHLFSRSMARMSSIARCSAVIPLWLPVISLRR